MSCFFHKVSQCLKLVILFCLLGVMGSAHAWALTVKSVRLGVHTGTTRVVLDLSDQSAFRVFTLSDPWRLVVDLPTYDWQAGSLTHMAGTDITSLRQGSLQPGTSRIIFQLQKPVAVRNAFIIPRKDALNARLVIDFAPVPAATAEAQKAQVFGHLQASAARNTEIEAQTAPPEQTAPIKVIDHAPPADTADDQGRAPPPPQDNIASARDDDGTTVLIHPAATKPAHTAHTLGTLSAPKTAPPPASSPAAEVAADAEQDVDTPDVTPKSAASHLAPGEKPMIIIDPGHGGVDPGTIGTGGIYEKNVTLANARALRDALISTGRYRVLLTRDGDVYLKLHERVDFARQHKGDLFISLHADSSPNGNDVGGASIYTLSDTASDAETAKLAMRENRADLVAGVDLSDQDDDVANILVDLAMRDTMNQSKFFANTVVSNMQSHEVRTLERTHRAAGFAVLKDPDVPSILVEMGFLSNPVEAQALSKPQFQHRLAKTLTDSIDAYFTKVRQSHRT